MLKLEYPHPRRFRPTAPLSPLAQSFSDSLFAVEIGHALDSKEEDTGEIEIAIADAIAHYCLIGLTPHTIIKRLIDHL